MANLDHIKILNQGAQIWNDWRKNNPEVIPDFSGFIFTYTYNDVPNLTGVDLSHANLQGADITGPDRDWPGETAPTFENANFEAADLSGISMFRTHFTNANLRNANFQGANITSVGFRGADLSYASFSGAILERTGFTDAHLVQTNFEGTVLKDVKIPNVKSLSPIIDKKTTATAIEVVAKEEGQISVDDLELAQMFSLLLNSDKLSNLINIATEKIVLILGRFSKERKEILDAIRLELRNKGFIALVYDFEGPTRRNITETISLLAHLSRFVVADITDAKSIPQELQATVPHLPSVVFQPILEKDKEVYSMFENFILFPWFLPIFIYQNEMHLISCLEDKVIMPAITKSDEILRLRNNIKNC
jgi:uncharacterized protein YjbI with pentapeptide repeats